MVWNIKDLPSHLGDNPSRCNFKKLTAVNGPLVAFERHCLHPIAISH